MSFTNKDGFIPVIEDLLQNSSLPFLFLCTNIYTHTHHLYTLYSTIQFYNYCFIPASLKLIKKREIHNYSYQCSTCLCEFEFLTCHFLSSEQTSLGIYSKEGKLAVNFLSLYLGMCLCHLHFEG